MVIWHCQRSAALFAVIDYVFTNFFWKKKITSVTFLIYSVDGFSVYTSLENLTFVDDGHTVTLCFCMYVTLFDFPLNGWCWNGEKKQLSSCQISGLCWTTRTVGAASRERFLHRTEILDRRREFFFLLSTSSSPIWLLFTIDYHTVAALSHMQSNWLKPVALRSFKMWLCYVRRITQRPLIRPLPGIKLEYIILLSLRVH